MSLADEILDATNRAANRVAHIESISVEDYPDRFFELHPSTYMKDGYILCENEVLCPDQKTLMRLLDHPRAKLDYAATCWLFERIKERAPILNDRYIVVSEEFMWDRVESRLIPLPPYPKTTNNKTTRRRLRDEQRRSDDGVGSVVDASAIY